MNIKEIILRGSMLAGVVLLGVLATGCNDDDDYEDWYYNRNYITATARNAIDGQFILVLNDSTVLHPRNVSYHPFDGKTVRVYGDVSLTSASWQDLRRGGDFDCVVNGMDSILTKKMVHSRGASQDAETYGKDYIDVEETWETALEDGFLTIKFRTSFSGVATHTLNLVQNEDDPYTLRFRQNRNGDPEGRYEVGLVAFDVSDLPSTGGAKHKVVLEWDAGSGIETETFYYRKP